MNKHHPLITRRDFLKGTAAATLAASLSCNPLESIAAAIKPVSTVTIVRDEKVLDRNQTVNMAALQQMLDQTVIHVTGMSDVNKAWNHIIRTDDVVGLVPTPHLNPTHDELVDLVKASIMQEVGLDGEHIIMAQGGVRRPRKCTALIAMPGLKAHWLTGTGTVLKNYIMYSGAPTRYHGAKSAKLGEIWLKSEVKDKTRLILVDALYPLCDKGPQPDPRYQWHYNGLIAGTDPVAVETIGLKIITEKRKLLRGEPWPLQPPPICVEAADKVYGLGNSDWAKIKVNHFGWDEGLLV